MHEGVDGLLRHKSRPPGKAPVPPERVAEIVRPTREPPPFEAIPVILDNYAAHKKDKVRQWLARYPRWTLHFTSTSRSWLNAVEDSSPSRPGAGSSMASSTPSSIFRPPSTASFVNTMPATRNHSSGKPIPTTSSPLETVGSKRWNQSTRRSRGFVATQPGSGC